MKSEDIHVLSYVNSFLADVELGKKSSFCRNLYHEAAERDFLVMNDTKTAPLLINSGPNFRAGLVDLFNPEAFEWLKNVFIDMFEQDQISGYMADFGEFLPPGSHSILGKSTSSDHNRYAEEWSRLQEKVLESVGQDKLIFHRSGFTKSPSCTKLFWTGDQLVSWDEYDGLKAGLVFITY
jgi:alpha-glucosidase